MKNRISLEFNRQADHLINIGYHLAAGVSERAFRMMMARLQSVAERLTIFRRDLDEGRLPFVIVIKSEMVPTRIAMKKIIRSSRSGHVAMKPVTPDQFNTIEGVILPKGSAYLLIGIDRGMDTLNVRPEDAMKIIKKRRRSPLTIDEGVAIVTHFPEFLKKNNCFSLLASRRHDQRVPALWISGENRPKLGWCWDRNPHTWLGSASCRKRVGLEKN